jgi:hypothetical protein
MENESDDAEFTRPPVAGDLVEIQRISLAKLVLRSWLLPV